MELALALALEQLLRWMVLEACLRCSKNAETRPGTLQLKSTKPGSALSGPHPGESGASQFEAAPTGYDEFKLKGPGGEAVRRAPPQVSPPV